jgi:hypothetical protein
MKCIVLVALVCCVALSVDARSLKKRQGAAAGLSAAAEATNAVNEMIKTVGSTLTSGSSNVALVRWAGDLTFNVDLAHGKTIMADSDNHGGVVAVMKRDCALVGAEANVVLYANGQVVGKVYLTTFYNGDQPLAQLVTGSANFAQQSVNDNGSTALVLAYITPNDSNEVSSNSIPYSQNTASGSYNAASSTIQS